MCLCARACTRAHWSSLLLLSPELSFYLPLGRAHLLVGWSLSTYSEVILPQDFEFSYDRCHLPIACIFSLYSRMTLKSWYDMPHLTDAETEVQRVTPAMCLVSILEQN